MEGLAKERNSKSLANEPSPSDLLMACFTEGSLGPISAFLDATESSGASNTTSYLLEQVRINILRGSMTYTSVDRNFENKEPGNIG